MHMFLAGDYGFIVSPNAGYWHSSPLSPVMVGTQCVNAGLV